VTLDAFFFRFLCTHTPYVGLMAFFALHANNLQMKIMLANFGDVLMAGKAITPVGSDLCVRLMALVAVELHGGVLRNIDFYRFLYGLL